MTTPGRGPFGRLAAAVLARRGLAITIAVALVLTALASALRIRLDFSSTAFYGADDPAAAQLEAFHERWGPDDATLVLLARRDAPLGVLEPGPLRALEALSSDLRASPLVAEVVDLNTVVGAILPGTESLAEDLEQARPEVQEVMRRMLRRSAAVPRLLAADGSTTVLLVELRQGSDDVQAIAPQIAQLHELVQQHQGSSELQLDLAGVPAIRASFFRLAIDDQLRLGPLVGLALGLLLAISLRRVHGVLVPLVLAGVPVASLVGLMAATDEPIGLLNQAYFTLLPVIAVADAVHLVSRLHEILRRDDIDLANAEARRAAIIEACDRTGVACLWTTVTTGAGFLSLALARMPMLRAFGLYAAAGIALAYLALLLLGPLLLDAVRSRPPARPRRMADLARWSTRRLRPLAVLGTTILLAALAVLGARRVVVDNHLSDLLPQEHPVRRASATLDESMGGTLAIELQLRSVTPWTAPEPLDTLRALESWARQQPEIRSVTGPGSVLALLPSPPERTPAPLAALRARVLAEDDHLARITLGVPDLGGRRISALAERLEDHLATLSIETTITGTTLLAYRGVNRIASELRGSLLGVALVVTLAIGLLLRSLRLALLALVPNLMPLALAYGALGLLGIELDPLAAVILCVALGIAVDDTLHLLARVREGQRAGLDRSTALEHAVATSGHAALVTTVALTGGLALNLASSFPPLHLLGGLGAAAIALAWLFDVLVLPALWRLTTDRPFEREDARHPPG